MHVVCAPRHLRVITALVVALAVSACATGPDSLDASKLAKARQITTLDVSPISVYDGQIALVGGEYKSELEDSLGVFYRGPGRSFRFVDETYPGGIYVTKPPSAAKYRLYYYKTTAPTVDITPTIGQVVQTTTPAATPLAAGVGAGIGAGAVAIIQHMDDGKLMLLQPIEGVDYRQLVRVRN